MTKQWNEFITQLSNALGNILVTDNVQNDLPSNVGMAQWTQKAVRVRENDKTLFFVGNGASASMASHFSADVAKNARIRTWVFTDPALLTAVSNDVSYEDSYAEPIRWFMKEGDMLVAISSSGNSPNIVQAVKAALQQGGTVVTLSAMNENNSIRQLGHLNFYLPADTYGLAETGHAAVLHYWMDAIEK